MSLYIGKTGNWILRKVNKHSWLDRAVDRISNPACRFLGGTPRLTRDMFNLYQKIQLARNVDPRAIQAIEIRGDGFYAAGPGNKLMEMGPNPLGEHFPSPVTLRLELDTTGKLTKYMRGLRRMIRQYKKRGGDLGFYEQNILPLLIENAKTPEELKIWEKEIKALLVISLKVFGKINLILPKISKEIGSLEDIKEVRRVIADFYKETGVIGGDFEHIFLRTIEKIKSLPELEEWFAVLKDMVNDFRPEHGDRSAYLRGGLLSLLRRVGSLEELEEAQLLVSDYIQKYGNPRDYIKEAVLPLLSRAESIDEFKEARFMIADYIRRGFNDPIGYAKDCVLRLAEKLSEEKLRVAREFLIDYSEEIGDPRDVIEYAVCRILDKADSPAELWLWGKEIKTLVLDFKKKFGDPHKYFRTALNKLMGKVRSIEELTVARHFIVEVGEEFEEPEPYICCIEFSLLLVLDKILLPPEINKWGVEIKKFIIDTKMWFKDHRDCVENALPAIIANVKSPAFIKVAKYQMRDFSVKYGYQREYVTEIIPRIMARANEISDVGKWDKEAVGILNILGPELGFGHLAGILDLDQCRALSQFAAWREQIDMFLMDYRRNMQAVPGKKYITAVLFRVLSKSKSLEDFEEWRGQVREFLSDYSKVRKFPDKDRIPDQLLNYLDDSPTLAHFVAARSFPFINGI
jgi:hypothetical protein